MAQHDDHAEGLSDEEAEDLNFELHNNNFHINNAFGVPRRQMIEEIDNDDEDDLRI